MFEIENLNIGKIWPRFGNSELRENFLKRGGSGRDLAGNEGSLGGFSGVYDQESNLDS